jgi:RimJ/RimL family protein N-acetyltransferase
MTTALDITVGTAHFREDFESVRHIRNAGREWMTDTHEVTTEMQEAFRASRPRLLIYRMGDVIVGYGMVTRRGEHLWVSLAVRPDYQGQGIGTHIYFDQRKRWTDDAVYAACRPTNAASIRAAEKAGYVLVPEMSYETWTVLRGDARGN